MKHIFFMPDGNRRYAKKEKISFDEAYKEGAKTLKLFTDFFLIERDWDELTFYFMSKYTHERTDGSLKPIYNSLFNTFSDLQKKRYFQKNNIKLIMINHSENLPKEIIKLIGTLSEETKNSKKIVRVLLGYDLESDEKEAFNKAKNYEEFKMLRLVPDIDLVARTTEMRPSKGPVYAMKQSQMMLLNKLNPELNEEDLKELIKQYDSHLDYRKTTNPIHQIKK